MRISLKREILLLALLATTYAGMAGDSLRVNSFNSPRLTRLGNGWLGTGNSAGLVFNQSTKWVGFETGVTERDGDFHLIREGNKINDYSFSTESYQSQGKRFFFYGKFAYHSIDEKGGQWNGTYDPYNGNPYILADSISGTTYHKENYHLISNIGYKWNDHLSMGCGIDYFVAVAAKQKDPRPLNKVIKFKINPSFILTAPKYKIGFDFGYKHSKEEIGYDVYRSSLSPTFFCFKGFGFYSKEIGSLFDRMLNAHEIFGGIQLEKAVEWVQTLSELRFNYNIEGIEDGSSIIRKLDGGEWSTYNLLFREQVNLRKGQAIHRFSGDLSFFNGDGNESMQYVVYDGPWHVQQYVTFGEFLKFNRQNRSGTISYDYLKLENLDRTDWDISASLNYFNNHEKYYFVPELFSSGYSNLTGNFSVQKNLYFGKLHWALSLNSAYTSNLSKELNLSDLPEITKLQRADIYLQEFDYYTSSLLKIGGEVKWGGRFLQLKNLGQIYLGLRYDRVNQIEGNRNFSLLSTKLGFVF